MIAPHTVFVQAKTYYEGGIPEESRKEFLAYYLNRAKEWGKEVVVTYKQEDLPKKD
jgi:hypothetical protein